MDIRSKPAAGLTPPFCPNPKCPFHCQLTSNWRWKRAGHFSRLTPPYLVPRFTCRCCRRSFSSQTFSITYWLKRPELPQLVFMKAVGGMAHRQIARDLQVAPSTIDRLIARLGRHCLLLHTKLTAQARPQGPVVLDGFESFEFSQFFPFQHHVLVEAETSFFLHFTDTPLRRKGRMTDLQKRRREQLEARLGRPDPRALEQDVQELLQASLGDLQHVTLRSDDHRAYPRALRRLRCECTHEITSAKQRRDVGNPLFEINLLDGLIRHSQANHRRETLAWSKRRQSSAERLAMLLVWRNYVKLRWEKRCRQTPAMLKGLLEKRLQVADLLRQRLFRTRIELPRRWAEYYDRTVRTAALERNKRHELKYAY
jgi:transposase-like protein